MSDERTAEHLARCPARRAGLLCPGIDAGNRGYVHPRFCALFDADPETWGPIILEEAGDDVALAERRAKEKAQALADEKARRESLSKRFIRPWDSSQPIRLGLVNPGFVNIGGTEKWLLDLLRATSTPPFEWVGVACQANEGHLPQLVAEVGRYAPVTYGHAAIPALGRAVDILLSWGIDSLHQQLGPDAGCRTVFVSHNLAVSTFTVRTLADSYAATACVGVARQACEAFHELDQPRCHVIYNTASVREPSLSRADQRRLWGVPEGAKVVGYLGRICHQKYAEGFVAAIAALPGDYVGVMVGSGPEYVDQAVAAHGVARRIVRPGMTEHPENALVAFDVLLMPSRYEAHSIALTEAWLAGVPVITTAIAFTAEHPELSRIVKQEATGEVLARAVLDDVADTEGTRARVEHAREFARTELTFERFRDGWRGLLTNLVGTEAGSRSQRVDGPSIAPPPLWRKVANLAGAATTIIADGARRVSSDVARQRLSICEGCPFFIHESKGCQKCGCNMPWKVLFSAMACPDQPPRWPAELPPAAAATASP